MRKALVHEWYEHAAGSEKCIESFTNMWDDFDHYALVDFLPAADRGRILKGKPVRTTFIQRLPAARSAFRYYLPLFPFAIEQLDLSGYDLVVSNSHAVAKGVITGVGQMHICYCHSPMRYAWDLYHQYVRQAGLDRGIKGLLARAALHRLRVWDATTVNRVDHFIANSHYTAARIRRTYNREAAVIYPPVDTDRFAPGPSREEFYLTASRLVPYKRVDLIVEAFATMPDRRLVVVGEGPEMETIKRAAAPNVEILGYQNFDALRSLMQRAKAFVFAAVEDFGIVVVEAMACGTPVIGLGKGGARETIQAGVSGVHFPEQTAASIVEAVGRFERSADTFDGAKIADYARRFSRGIFEEKMKRYIEEKAAAKFGGG
jgi:glycosyltransferase involved in cell wall biosynthesis